MYVEVETGQSLVLLPTPALGWAVFCLLPPFLPVTDSYCQTSYFTREHFSVPLKETFIFNRTTVFKCSAKLTLLPYCPTQPVLCNIL